MKLLRWLSPLSLLLLTLNSQARTHAKTIVFNRTTGFAETLPFDEYFRIRLEGFSADTFKMVQMVFREMGHKRRDDNKPLKCRKKKNTSAEHLEEDKFPETDSAYYASLPVLMNISFDNNRTGVAYMKLEPSKYYFVELKCEEKVPLSKPERDALSKMLQKDKSIIKDYMDSLKKGAFTSIHIDALNAILLHRIKQVKPAYKVGTMVKETLDSAMNSVLGKIKSSSAEAGEYINDVIKTVDGNGQLKVYGPELRALFETINFGNNDAPVYLPSVTHSWAKYQTDIDNIFQKLSTAQPDQAAALEDTKSDIKTGLKHAEAQMDLMVKLVDQTIDIITGNIYIIRDLAFTKPDEAVVEGTANRLNASISQTFGWGLSPKTSGGFLYVGYSLFPRAVNSSVPFRNIPCKDRWKAMLGINLGFTLTDMTTNNYGEASGIVSFLGDKALMTGICFRPYHFIKIDFNGLLYALNDPNPLINHKKLAFAPLIGISLSLNVVKLFNGQPNSFTTLSEQLK